MQEKNWQSFRTRLNFGQNSERPECANTLGEITQKPGGLTGTFNLGSALLERKYLLTPSSKRKVSASMENDGTALAVAISPATNDSSSNALSPEEQLAIMHLARSLPKATGSKLSFLLYALEAGHALDSYSDSQIASEAGCRLRTGATIRAWLKEHNLLRCYDLEVKNRPFANNCEMKCSTELPNTTSLETEETTPSPLHNANNCTNVDNSVVLARKLLDEIDFLRFHLAADVKIPCPGRERKIEAWLQRYGAKNILYAIWVVTSLHKKRKAKNPAGLVRSFVQDGRTAPNGWQHPALRPQEPLSPAPALQIPVHDLSTPALPVPETSPELLPVFDWLKGQLRPASWEAWFEPTSMTLDGNTVNHWIPSTHGAQWIEDYYKEKIRTAFQEVLGQDLELAIRVPSEPASIGTDVV